MSDEYDEVLLQLDALRFTPARSEAAARSGLQDFLEEAARLRSTVVQPPVSARLPRRLTGWMFRSNQERSPMLALAIKVVVVIAVMFGGAGVTAVTAQSSLPNETLYPVKLFIEDVATSLAAGPEAQIDVQLDQVQQRVYEMAQLSDRGAVIPAEVMLRLQAELQAALRSAAQLDDQTLVAALDRIQLRTQDQLREMEQLHVNDAAQALTQAREMAQLGQNDPQTFRARLGLGRPVDAAPQPPLTPPADPSLTPQPSPTVQPTQTVQPSRTLQPSRTPQPSDTPQPTDAPQGAGYGPGPQITGQPATPLGQGAGHESRSQPTSTPGNDDGNGVPQLQPTPQKPDGSLPSTPQGTGKSPATPAPGSNGNGFNGNGGIDTANDGFTSESASGSGSGRP